MLAGLFFVLWLSGLSFARNPPEIDCLVLDMDNAQCMWNKGGPPDVNYTFFSRFAPDTHNLKCVTPIFEYDTVVGCRQPYKNVTRVKRFNDFYTTLVYGNDSFQRTHILKARVKLNAPTNVTVRNGTDGNLWFYWNTTFEACGQNQVQYRTNYNKWEEAVTLGFKKRDFCINLPSSTAKYEFRVRTKIGENCGKSDYWSEWSPSVFWGSVQEANDTDTSRPNGPSMGVWTPVLYLAGILTLILFAIMLVHRERIRVIFIPINHKLATNLDGYLIDGNLEDWLPVSKDLIDGLKSNFNERACCVREYSRLPLSGVESSETSSSSVSTNQTDCSTSPSVSEEGPDPAVPLTP